MNKTAILSFILDEVVLKARNVSSNMRKRIHWMLEEREITVKKYDKRALILNGWVRVRKTRARISKLEDMKKGVSNYHVQTQEQLDKLISLNNEIRCYKLDFIPTGPVKIESVEWVITKWHNWDCYSNCSFNKVKWLIISQASTEQILDVITRFKRIDKLGISYSSLKSIDFSKFKINKFYFEEVSFKEPVNFPRRIAKLNLKKCKFPNLIKVERVNKIVLLNEDCDSREFVELAKSLKGVKVVKTDKLPPKYLTSLPSTIRKIYSKRSKYNSISKEEIAKHFPYLIHFDTTFPIEATSKTQLKMINPIMNDTKEKFSLRPRKITVTSDNAVQLNNHSELFERVECAVIQTNEFNFDVLPTGIKTIRIDREVNEESSILNRLERERE